MSVFTFEETDDGDAGPTTAAAPGAREVDVETARTMLEESFGGLMRRALQWHRRNIRAETLKRAHEIWGEPRPGETEGERRERQRMFAWREPTVPTPPQDGAKVTTGGGKSTVARNAAVQQFIFEARVTAETFIIAAKPTYSRDLLEARTPEQVKQIRDWLDAMPPGMEEETARITKALGLIEAPPTPHRVFIAVPTHELAYEANRKVPAGVTCAIYQGREAFKVRTKEPMCKNLPAVKAALKLGADVQKTACKSGKFSCEFYDECLYQAMLRECARADVVFGAHELLFKMPAVLGEFGLTIIDEGFWQSGLFGENKDHPIRLCIAELVSELDDYPVNKKVDGPKGRKITVRDEERTAQLRELLERLQKGLTDKPRGYVRYEYLEEHLRGELRHARILEWARKPELGLRPGDGLEAYDAAVAQHGKFAGSIQRRVDMWRAVENLLHSYDAATADEYPWFGNKEATGRLSIKCEDTEEGRVRQLEIMGHRQIDGRLLKLPIIHADATLQLELSRYYLPRLKLAIDLRIAAPHARVTQVIGEPVGLSGLRPLPEGKRTAEEEARVARKRKRLVNTSRKLMAGRDALVITYLAIEDEYKTLPNVDVAHHGAIEGIDRWGEVEAAVIIGRSMPWKTDLARLAAAITGKPVVTDTVKQERLVGADGGGSKVQVWTCTDPDAELVRAAITEAGVEQAHGRVRAVNRTAANPVEVYLMLSDTVVPGLKVDEVVKFQAIEPGPVEEMLERGSVLQSSADAWCLFPDLFDSPAAAKKAYQRGGGHLRGTTPYKDISIRKCPPKVAAPSRPVRYRRAGARKRLQLAWVDLAKVPDPRAVLEAAFKEKLELFELLDGPGVEPAQKRKRQRIRKPEPKRKHRRKHKPEPECRSSRSKSATSPV